MDVYSRTPIGVFNPHIWPPNLEGVRGTPTVTRLITIDRQLFYEQCEESVVSTQLQISTSSVYQDGGS